MMRSWRVFVAAAAAASSFVAPASGQGAKPSADPETPKGYLTRYLPEVHGQPVRYDVKFLADPILNDDAVAGKAMFAWNQDASQWRNVSWNHGPDGVDAHLIPVDDSLRGQLNLPEGRGLVVAALTPGGRAEKAGIKANDILLTLADKPLGKPEDVLEHLKKAQARPGHAEEAVPLDLLRAGKRLTIHVRPEVRVALASANEEEPDFYIGTPANPLDETLRAHLEIAEGTGLIVGEIAEGSPAAKAGVKKNDILLAFDGQPLADVEALRTKIQDTGGKPAKLRVLRAGKPVELTVTPERRKAEPEANSAAAPFAAQFLYDRAFRGAGSNFAVEGLNLYNHPVPLHGNPNVPGGAASGDPSKPASPDLAKKIDDLNAKVVELTKAVEALRKQAKADKSK